MAVTLYSSFNTATGDLQVSDVESDVQLAGYTELEAFTNAALVVPDSWPWHSYRSEITTAKVKSAAQVFRTSYMFAYCSILTFLDLSGFDTSKVTDMVGMFTECSKLKSIDLSGFDTSNVTDMNGMFAYCLNLTSLDLSGFDTSKVTSMYGMFSDCSNLTSLDLSSFDTSNVTDMFAMFTDCSALRIIAVSGSMSNALAQLPASQYYPASGGSPVAKADLTAGTWVRDEADLSKHTTIVQQAQAAMQLRRDVSKAAKRVSALEAKLS